VNFNYKVPGDQTRDNDASIKIVNGPSGAETLDVLKTVNNSQYFQAKSSITNIQMLLPATPAIMGIYAYVDSSRGVWKAPANVNITNVIAPEFLITHEEQKRLNVDDVAGKSINVIRKFDGRGPAFVWGARTLAGNDNATEQFVFEPNDENTWVRVKSMIQNYLTQQWKSGALQGASVKEAFFVHIGLGETMTNLDLLEGRMIVEIGLAVVRPAEFIILRFMHKMLSES
jgi:phage tail sheath protein FI